MSVYSLTRPVLTPAPVTITYDGSATLAHNADPDLHAILNDWMDAWTESLSSGQYPTVRQRLHALSVLSCRMRAAEAEAARLGYVFVGLTPGAVQQ